ncbi:MAG: hypothetical protein GWN13_14410 [Phycisphaerae bacterium]|nr:hypothetical protein [Phycisphaerae bacterium]NIW99408.1 hypothetical protein [Phycisphaerae bacterium]
MRLRQIASNMTELHTDAASVLFSYATPVAGWVDGTKPFKTDTHYSATTTRHVNKYFREVWGIDPGTVKTIPQAQIDALIK